MVQGVGSRTGSYPLMKRQARVQGTVEVDAKSAVRGIRPQKMEQGGLPTFRPSMWRAYLDLIASFHGCTYARSQAVLPSPCMERWFEFPSLGME